MSIIEVVRQIGTNATMQGVLAVVGLVALIKWAIGLYKPKDNFRFQYDRFNKLNLEDEKQFFAEKAEFERNHAMDDADQSFRGAYYLFAIASFLIAAASLAAIVLLLPRGSTGSYVAYGCWAFAFVIAWRHKAYLSRRASRYEAFLAGDIFWATAHRGKKGPIR